MTLEKAKLIKGKEMYFIIARKNFSTFIIYNGSGFFDYPSKKHIDNLKRISLLKKMEDWQVYDAREVVRPFGNFYLDFKNLPIVAEVS